MLSSLRQKIWYCRRLNPGEDGWQDGIETFCSPAERWLNVLPISGEQTLASGGELSTRYLRARQAIYDPDRYFEGDRVFYGAEPKEFDPIEPGANYVIRSVLPGYRVTEIMMERLV